MDSHCHVARWHNGQSKPGLNSFEFTRKIKLLMIQHFGSDQVSLSEVIAVSMRSQYYTLIEQSLMTLSEQNAIRFSEKKITVITVQCSRGAIKMPCFNTALTILYYGLLVGISLEFPHAMVWLVWHFYSEKADFFFFREENNLPMFRSMCAKLTLYFAESGFHLVSCGLQPPYRMRLKASIAILSSSLSDRYIFCIHYYRSRI